MKNICVTCVSKDVVVWVKIPDNTYCVECYGKHHDKSFWRYYEKRCKKKN